MEETQLRTHGRLHEEHWRPIWQHEQAVSPSLVASAARDSRTSPGLGSGQVRAAAGQGVKDRRGRCGEGKRQASKMRPRGKQASHEAAKTRIKGEVQRSGGLNEVLRWRGLQDEELEGWQILVKEFKAAVRYHSWAKCSPVCEKGEQGGGENL